MRTLLICLGTAALLVSGRGQALASSPPPPPPPVVTDHRANAQRHLVTWTAGDVRCGGQAVTALVIRQPLSTLAFSSRHEAPPRRYRFRIDAEGRPLSIVQDGAAALGRAAYDDVAASLAASRFPPQSSRSDCAIAFTAQATPIDEAAAADLMAYSISPLSGRLPPEAWKQMAPAPSTCFDRPRPAVRNRAFPDFNALPATPGVRDWSMIGYDLNAKGQPVNLRVAESTGNNALDAASMKAIKASRFTPGERKSCLYPYWRTPGTIAAPARPDPASLKPIGSNCPADLAWATKPRLVYPSAYRRRAIEGWAAIAYDVAPWGEPGNVRVLLSEPAAAFGQQAVQIVRSARKSPSQNGATGCVDMIRFSIDQDDGSADPTFED